MHVLNRPSRHVLTVAAAACLALTVGLAGCQQPASDDDARVAELEQQVQDLQSQLDSQGAGSTAQDATATTDDASSAAASGSAASSGQGLAADVTSAYPELADFEARVAELEQACQDVQASDDRNANYQTFIGVKQQIDQLDHEMDSYDDQQEYRAKGGEMAYEDYMTVERAIDQLDERLDYAKDGMEIKLGIDD